MQFTCTQGAEIGADAVLLSFRVSNHRSLRDEQELDLRPVYDRSRPAVPVAAIFGANASGKSNAVDALWFMRSAVVSSHARWNPRGGIPRKAFRLGRVELSSLSGFAVDLLIDGIQYTFGFEVDDYQVRAEWLYSYPRGRRRVLFSRRGGEIDFGPSFVGPKSLIEEMTRANSLFLSAAAQAGHTQVLPVHSWFQAALVLADHTNARDRRRETAGLLEDPSTAARVLELVRVADLGIADIQLDESRRRLDETQRTEVARLLEGQPSAVSAIRELLHLEPGIVFVHGSAGGSTPLELDDESRGTLAWFDLIGPLVAALDDGGVLVVDEIDASLHPLLVRQLVRLFRNGETNPKGAQLIFTTHDTSLLARHRSEEVLRRDEIWFTEKDEQGATALYPLTDFRPREGLNWERRYLGGSVGAVPFLDDEDFEAALRPAGEAAHG